MLVSQLLLRVTGLFNPAAGIDTPLPDPPLAVQLLVSVAGALAIVTAAPTIVGPLTSLEETRFE
jgi:hypothetical protein